MHIAVPVVMFAVPVQRVMIAVAAVMVVIASNVVGMAVAGPGPGADPLDVVVMALLGQAFLGLEPEDPLPVLAELAVHQIGALQDLLDPLGECVEHRRVVVQIGRLDELDLRMAGRNPIGVRVDALHEHAGEEEVRKHGRMRR